MINEQGMSIKQVAKAVKRSEPTIWTWIRKLREAGYEVKTDAKGRKRLEI